MCIFWCEVNADNSRENVMQLTEHVCVCPATGRPVASSVHVRSNIYITACPQHWSENRSVCCRRSKSSRLSVAREKEQHHQTADPVRAVGRRCFQGSVMLVTSLELPARVSTACFIQVGCVDEQKITLTF